MRNLRLLLTLAALIVVALLLVAFSDNGATVINDFGCRINRADSGLPIVLFSTDTHSVVTPSGKASMICHFDIPDEYVPSKTMKHSGFLCGTHLENTYNSRSVTTKGGKVHLMCQITGKVVE